MFTTGKHLKGVQNPICLVNSFAPLKGFNLLVNKKLIMTVMRACSSIMFEMNTRAQRYSNHPGTGPIKGGLPHIPFSIQRQPIAYREGIYPLQNRQFQAGFGKPGGNSTQQNRMKQPLFDRTKMHSSHVLLRLCFSFPAAPLADWFSWRQ